MAVKQRITANARAIGASVHFIAYAIISLVVVYSDIMFIALMWAAFPGGFLTIAAVGGAFATGLSIIALVIGKSRWFRPGGQLIWAWCFTGVEIGISILNVVVSVMHSMNQPLGYLSTWIYCAPATPVVSLVGWIIVLYLDKDRAQLHEEMEMADDLANAEREHTRQVHEARMELKQTALQQQKEYLKMHLSTPEMQALIDQGSYEIARSIVSEIIQHPILPAGIGPASKIIDSTAQNIDDSPARAPEPRTQPAPRPRAPKKHMPRQRKFTPATPRGGERDTEELVHPPLASAPPANRVKVKQGAGPFTVNANRKERRND